MAIAINPNALVPGDFMSPEDMRKQVGSRDGEFEAQYFEPIERLEVRSRVIWPEWSQRQVASMQQKGLPDRRYGVNNWPEFDPRYYTGPNMDVREMHTKPRPLEAGMPYIPVAHILEQQPAVNLFDVRTDMPAATDVLEDDGPQDPRTVAPNRPEVDWEQLERTRGWHILNSRGAWNAYKQMEFIYANRDKYAAGDTQLSIMKQNKIPEIPEDPRKREMRLRERGLIRRMGGQS